MLLIIAIVAYVLGCLLFSYADGIDWINTERDAWTLESGAVFIILWPLFLTGLMIVLPFYGMYHLGRWSR